MGDQFWVKTDQIAFTESRIILGLDSLSDPLVPEMPDYSFGGPP